MAKGLYRRPDSPSWYYKFKLGGRLFRGSCEATSEHEARQRLAEARVEAAKTLKRDARQRGVPLTLGDSCKRWWDDVGQFTKNSLSAGWTLDWLKAEIGEGTRLDAIDGTVITQAVSKRRGEPRCIGGGSTGRVGGKLAPATVNRSVTEPLRKVLMHAHKRYGAGINRIEWEIYLLKEPKERVRSLTTDEERKLLHDLAAIREDYQPIVRFAMLTGARQAECYNLTWDKVDWGNQTAQVKGKGDKWRSIPLSQSARDLLWSLRGNHPEAVFTFVVPPKCPRRWLPADARIGDHVPISRAGLQAVWHRFMQKSGIKDFRFHDLRHTAATRILEATGNLALVQNLLGHSRIATTVRYAHTSAAQIAAGMEAAAKAAEARILEAQPESSSQPMKGGTVRGHSGR